MEIRYRVGDKHNDSIGKLGEYRAHTQAVVNAHDFTKPESSLATPGDSLTRAAVSELVTQFGRVTDVVVIGIGGSNLGTEAVHDVLKNLDSPRLHVLDMLADYKVAEVTRALSEIPKDQLAVCIVSKSGATTETLTNAEIFLTELAQLYGEVPYDRVIGIGNPDNELLATMSAQGAHTVSMQEAIGGRYSVFTSVGLVPLSLLGHDVDALLNGLEHIWRKDNEEAAAEGASSLYTHMQAGVRTVNFFTFESRLEKLGAWYRQLTAESLGKAETLAGQTNELGFIPVTSTPVELHSIGQLYFSGFAGVFTDFIVVDNKEMLYSVNQEPVFATAVAGKSMQEIAHAIEGGVLAAYGERNLPHRITSLRSLCAEEIGLFMGLRMLETMYLAKLMNVNAFDQPNVELYKEKTREILDNHQPEV